MAKQKRITVERNIKRATDSGKYYVTFYFGRGNDGNAVRSTRSYHTLHEAQIALKKHELEVAQQIAIMPSKLTLNKAVQEHIAVLENKLSPSTIYGYRTMEKYIRNHNIGNKKVQNIKPHDIQAYLLHLENRKGLTSNTALKHYNFLTSVFNLLEKQRIIRYNPASNVITPKNVKHEANYLTVEEALEIQDRIKIDRLYTAFSLGLYTGMRRGEICGLKWDAIDFDSNTISICLSRINVGDEIIEKEPKSDSSKRTLNMVSELKEVLLAEQRKQEDYREELGDEYSDEGYVICNNDGRPIRPNYLSEMFNAWFKKPENSDLRRITPHELRHTFVAFSIAAGVPLYEISQALGHGDIAITSRIYAHLLDETHTKVTESMARLLRQNE